MSDSRDDLLERARDVLLRVGSLAEQIAQRLSCSACTSTI